MTDSESVPYNVLLTQMELRLHQRDSEVVMLQARIAVRDQKIAQLLSGSGSAPGSATPPEGDGRETST